VLYDRGRENEPCGGGDGMVGREEERVGWGGGVLVLVLVLVLLVVLGGGAER